MSLDPSFKLSPLYSPWSAYRIYMYFKRNYLCQMVVLMIVFIQNKATQDVFEYHEDQYQVVMNVLVAILLYIMHIYGHYYPCIHYKKHIIIPVSIISTVNNLYIYIYLFKREYSCQMVMLLVFKHYILISEDIIEYIQDQYEQVVYLFLVVMIILSYIFTSFMVYLWFIDDDCTINDLIQLVVARYETHMNSMGINDIENLIPNSLLSSKHLTNSTCIGLHLILKLYYYVCVYKYLKVAAKLSSRSRGATEYPILPSDPIFDVKKCRQKVMPKLELMDKGHLK